MFEVPDIPDDPATPYPTPEELAALGEPLPPDDLPDLPDEAQEDPPASQADAPRVPDEILDPGALVPVDAILARLEGITAQDVARSIALSTRALALSRIETDDEQDDADALRDELQAHERHVKGLIDPYCDIANKLHKGMTGLRNVGLDRVPVAIKHTGDLIAAYIRRKEQAEAERQRVAREQAAAEERERLKREADAASAEAARLSEAAHQATDEQTRTILTDEATRASAAAIEASTAAHTVIAPPVAAREIEKPKGASVASQWKALPLHAEAQDDIPLNDLRALVVDVGQRAKDGDDSLLNLLKPNWKACNALAVSQMSAMKIGGLRAVDVASFRKRRG